MMEGIGDSQAAGSITDGVMPRQQLHRRAFSLIEIIVVIGIISVLVSLLMPALQSCRRAARNLKCASQLQKVAFEFRLFADDFAAVSRGNSDSLGPKYFFMEDFQEKMYGVAEFWDSPGSIRAEVDPLRSLMICPEANPRLIKRANSPHASGAIQPKQNVSFGFNRRLYRPGPDMFQVAVTSKVLDHPNVPLLIDSNGIAAAAQGKDAFYVAPPTDKQDGYDHGEYWFPSLRHGDRVNTAFVGGHVESSRHPDSEPTWAWTYQPDSP